MAQEFISNVFDWNSSGLGQDSQTFFTVNEVTGRIWVVRSWIGRIRNMVLTGPVTRLSFRAIHLDTSNNELWSRHLGVFENSHPIPFAIQLPPYMHVADKLVIESTPDDASANTTFDLRSSLFYLEVNQPT